MGTLLTLLPSLLLQGIPALLGVLAAVLAFVLRPGASRWWGGLAALALLALPSITGLLLTVFSLARQHSDNAEVVSFSVWSLLLPAVLPLLLGGAAVLICFFQRHDPLRRRVAGAVLVGYLTREAGYLLIFVVSQVLTGLFGVPRLL